VTAGTWLAENSMELASLQWVPTGAGLASSGDLGYTTGPFIATDSSGRETHGHYLSIWKRVETGPFSVVLDIGTTSPAAGPLPEAPPVTDLFESSDAVASRGEDSPDEEPLQSLLAVDRAYAVAQATGGTGRVLTTYGAPGVQIHRPGYDPMLGVEGFEAIGELAEERPSTSPATGDISRSGTLGYVYGSVAVGGRADVGNYVRIWRRDPEAPWTLAFELIDVLPE
jgi:hypothetical protein